MHIRSILALAALSFGLGAGLTQAQAQPQEQRDRARQQQPGQRQEPGRQGMPSRDGQQPSRQASPQRGPDYRQPAATPGRPPAQQVDRGRGAGPDRRFHRGDRLPNDYRSRQYVVEDWRDHRLSAPPRGHRWVQVGADYVLIVIATGVISQIILGQ